LKFARITACAASLQIIRSSALAVRDDLDKIDTRRPIRAYDAMIAAKGLANGLPVYTCNPDDFAGIEGLEVIPVPVPIAPSPEQTTDA
jgi:predicted nucleic acid-binding protein